MRFGLFLLLTAAVAPPSFVYAQQQEQPIKTTLCEIKKDPTAFNKKLVEVYGYGTHGFEDSMFEDPACFESADRVGIWMEYGGTVATGTKYCCGVTPSSVKKPLVVQSIAVPLVDDELFKRFDQLLHSDRHRPMRDISIRATVRARIFVAPGSVSGNRMSDFNGYGHMGCCMMLAVEQVLSVDSKKPEHSIFDLAREYEQKKK